MEENIPTRRRTLARANKKNIPLLTPIKTPVSRRRKVYLFAKINDRPIRLVSMGFLAQQLGLTRQYMRLRALYKFIPPPVVDYFYPREKATWRWFTEEELREYCAAGMLHQKRQKFNWESYSYDLYQRYNFLLEKFKSGEFPIYLSQEAKEYYEEIEASKNKRTYKRHFKLEQKRGPLWLQSESLEEQPVKRQSLGKLAIPSRLERLM